MKCSGPGVNKQTHRCRQSKILNTTQRRRKRRLNASAQSKLLLPCPETPVLCPFSVRPVRHFRRLPTTPRNTAVALDLQFWPAGNLHPTSYTPCPTHKKTASGRGFVLEGYLIQMVQGFLGVRLSTFLIVSSSATIFSFSGFH